MKTKLGRFYGLWMLAALMVLAGAGCRTPRVDWAGRVGIYTHDQAVTELGPPDRSAKLADGSVVAEWVTQRSYTRSYPTGGFLYGGGYYAGPMFLDTRSPEYVLRLSFGPDGRLKEWRKLVK